MLSFLADRSDLWDRLRGDLRPDRDGNRQMLRWDAPVQAPGRRAAEATVLRDVEIPEDARRIVVYGSANRDERAYPDPVVYDVDQTLSGTWRSATGSTTASAGPSRASTCASSSTRCSTGIRGSSAQDRRSATRSAASAAGQVCRCASYAPKDAPGATS